MSAKKKKEKAKKKKRKRIESAWKKDRNNDEKGHENGEHFQKYKIDGKRKR